MKKASEVLKAGRSAAASSKAKKKAKAPYVIVRANRSGVWAGELVSRKGTEVVLKDARRLWSWAGSASLSQMATTGTTKPDGCRFPAPVLQVDLPEAFEVCYCSSEGEKSIREVPVWQK